MPSHGTVRKNLLEELMKRNAPRAIACALLGLLIAGCGGSSKVGQDAKELEAFETAKDAYVYAYPLMTMDLTRRVTTNVVSPEGTSAPMGQFAKLREYPNASFNAVTAPNADTLYTTTWLDVSKEPWVVSIPDLKGRYALFPMLDGWTDVFQVPGKRTTGTGAQKYAITGPGWTGTLPAGVTEYKSPTSMVWILGRIYCTGTPQDYAAVHALQDKFTLVPLSSYGKPYTPAPGIVDPSSSDESKSVRDLVDAMDITTYFNYLAQLMKTNPPSADDAPLVARMAKIGLVPGQDFDPSKLGAFDKEAIRVVPKVAQLKIMDYFKQLQPVNGWMFTTKTGLYGTEYIQRALVTAIGLGANRPQDAIYPTGDKDTDGNAFDGASKK